MSAFNSQVMPEPCFEDLVAPGWVGDDELPAGGEQRLAGLQPGQQLLHLHKAHRVISICTSEGGTIAISPSDCGCCH
jgi:hypothetical protein